MPILFVICDSTPTSHIKAEFNILFGPIQIWKIATVPAWFTILYQRNSTPLYYKFNIFLDPPQTNYKKVPTQFTILHQHPTLNQNWIYFSVQYTKNILQQRQFNIFLDTIPIIHCTIAPTGFAILHHYPTNSIYVWIQHKQIIQHCQRNTRFYTNILHWIKIEYNFWSNTQKYIATAPKQFLILHQNPTLKSKSI